MHLHRYKCILDYGDKGIQKHFWQGEVSVAFLSHGRIYIPNVDSVMVFHAETSPGIIHYLPIINLWNHDIVPDCNCAIWNSYSDIPKLDREPFCLITGQGGQSMGTHHPLVKRHADAWCKCSQNPLWSESNLPDDMCMWSGSHCDLISCCVPFKDECWKFTVENSDFLPPSVPWLTTLTHITRHSYMFRYIV